MKLTKAQRGVLRCLAGGWIMDATGCDGMSAVLAFGAGVPSRNVSARTVSRLLNEGMIRVSIDGVSDYEITTRGLLAIKHESGRGS